MYGLVHKANSYHPVHIIFYEWKNIFQDLKLPISWKQKYKYVIGLSGWSHDGSRATSRQMRQQQKNKN